MKGLGRQIICAGGLLDEEGKMKDSALVMEFPDRTASDKYLAHESCVSDGVRPKTEAEILNVVPVNGEKRDSIGTGGGDNVVGCFQAARFVILSETKKTAPPSHRVR